MKYLPIIAILLSILSMGYSFSLQRENTKLGAEILTTVSSDTLNTFRTNVNSSFERINSQIASSTQYVSGLVQLATQSEASLGTASSSNGTALVLPASIATSTYNSATAANKVVVTQSNGTIDGNFFAATTTIPKEFATTTYIGDIEAWQIGMQKQIITTTGTSTFAVPSGIKKLWVEVVGAGGEGGIDGTDTEAGSGGGGGGYAQEIVDVSATSSVQVYVGPSLGARTTFGTIGYHFLTATGGSIGGNDGGAPGGGGVGSGGDINLGGYTGTDNSGNTAGLGGGTFYGIGGTGYGIGGDGCNGSSGNPCNSNDGGQGIIIIRW